ncbi:MAG: nucleotidyltransferase domain-containing protein [Bacteroides sp.]|nr:nucleotidyltransferase domain-containing protein [Bacteroides sp.]
MNILELAKRNQQKAWEIIEDTRIVRIWEGIGAKVNLVGSLRTGLLMKHRDIDFHIYTSPLDLSASFRAIIQEGSRYDGYFERVAERISAVLTDEMRLAILKLKYETPDTEKIMGVEYYQAVIQDGVRSYPEFEEWRRLHPVVGVVEWMP